jgi:hypothetical protein
MLTNELKREIKQKIQDFFDSQDKHEDDALELPYITLPEYAEILAELGCNTLKKDGSIKLMEDGNDYDTNGWSVDFWWHFKRGKENYTLGGSLFYGDFHLSIN